MKIGYARVSTEAQNLDRQVDALQEYGVDEIYTEKMTGTKSHRPELDKVRLRMRAGDKVVVESLSRLGRSTKDLLNLLDEFDEKGIQLVSLKEDIDTATPTGKLLVTVLSALSQFERDLIVQRTQEGLKAARARGRKGGRPKVDSHAVEKAIKLYEAKVYSVGEICKLTGISPATLYRNAHKQ
ncbi:MAG: recombinase family protein [Faecalibacterium sp.]|jgi:DNA invertase Pin-like site-specific DNA recombinase|nr:recombinase family protein [Faecalibacterium sp.]